MSKLIIFFVKQVNDIRKRGVTELVKKIKIFTYLIAYSPVYFLAFLFYTSHAIFYGIPVVFLGIVLLYFSLPNESRKIKYRKKID